VLDDLNNVRTEGGYEFRYSPFPEVSPSNGCICDDD